MVLRAFRTAMPEMVSNICSQLLRWWLRPSLPGLCWVLSFEAGVSQGRDGEADYLQFYEYFHGDNGAGLGANHQTVGPVWSPK